MHLVKESFLNDLLCSIVITRVLHELIFRIFAEIMRHKRGLDIPETPANLLEMVSVPNQTAPLVDHMP